MVLLTSDLVTCVYTDYLLNERFCFELAELAIQPALNSVLLPSYLQERGTGGVAAAGPSAAPVEAAPEAASEGAPPGPA